MAVFKYSKPLKFSSFLDFDSYSEESATLTRSSLEGSLNGYKASFKGSFDFWVWDPYYHDNKGVDGTIRSITVSQNGKTVLSVTGLSQDFMNLDHTGARSGVEAAMRLLMLGNDRVEGSSGNDVLSGYAGSDIMDGAGGNDALAGDWGNDWLRGGAGRDQLTGGAGSDRLVGGAGSDQLTGGAGADHFVFGTASESVGRNRDIVTDFSEQDFINLRAIDADTTRAGNQNFHFIDTRVFSGVAGELREKFGNVAADTDGDGQADLYVKLVGTPGTNVGADDFIL